MTLTLIIRICQFESLKLKWKFEIFNNQHPKILIKILLFFIIISPNSVCNYFLLFEINLIGYNNLKKSKKIFKINLNLKKNPI